MLILLSFIGALLIFGGCLMFVSASGDMNAIPTLFCFVLGLVMLTVVGAIEENKPSEVEQHVD